MLKVIDSKISLCFDPQKHTQELLVHLPEDSIIMSVKAKKNKLYVRFICKTCGNVLYNKYHFYIYKYKNGAKPLENKYIKYINVENNTYAVVCKKSSLHQ